ncbi:hypothetical protein ACHQM5_030401 [Ranunculus cassubicifolius]
MTNTIYFDLYRDDTSGSSSSEVTEERRPVSSSLYSVIGKAFSAWSVKESGNFRHNNTATAVLSDRNGTWFVFFACFVAASGGLIFGYDIGISGGVTSMRPFL